MTNFCKPTLSAVFLLCTILSAHSQDNLWRQDMQAATAATKANDLPAQIAALSKLHADFPANSRVLRNLAWTLAKAGKNDEALSFLQDYGKMGASLDPAGPIYKDLARLGILEKVPAITANQTPVSHGSRVFALPTSDLISEDITFDPAKKRFLITSVRKRKIVSCDISAKCEDVVPAASQEILNGMFAIHVDAKRNLLWATTAGGKEQEGFRPEDEGRSALIKFDLSTFRELKRYEPLGEGQHALGDMTLSAAGDVYVSDGLSGDVYVVDHRSDELTRLVPAGTFVSPQTPALNADGSLLYVPDYSQGIAVIELKTRRLTWMKTRTPQALEGIDGMYWTPGHLIAVQNGAIPERLVSFALQGNDLIVSSKVLEAGWKGLGDPTHGVVVGKDFYFIVNSGWDRVDDKGSMAAGPPPEIWKMSLTSQ